MLRLLLEKYDAHKGSFFVAFIDFEKAFDNVNWPILMQKLSKRNIPGHLIKLMRNLYTHQQVIVRVNNHVKSLKYTGVYKLIYVYFCILVYIFQVWFAPRRHDC